MALSLWSTQWAVLLLALLYAFFPLFRYSINIGFIERPLVQGVIWGAITGQPMIGFNIGVFFELLWLDLFPAGTFIPPQSVFAVFASTVLVRSLSTVRPEEVFLIMLVCIPFAFLGSWFENRQREWQNKNYNLLLRWASNKQGHSHPQKMVLTSISQQFILNFVFGAATLYLLLFAGQKLLPYLPAAEFFTWPMAWLAAAIGGIMSLRLRRAYALFFCGLAGAAGVMCAGWLNLLPV